MIQKSYNGEASLYIVPTPIGNLNDITKRAIDILTKVDAIFAEDTRVTLELLNALSIKNKLFACHKFTEAKVTDKLLGFLKDGKNIALVTDRGTPLISDPGSLVVQNIIKEGINVIALPGACAFIPALNMSGLDQDRFIFYGFLSSKDNQCIKELEKLKELNFTIIFYEAPHRLCKTLQNMLKVLGNRNISISREISKIHEEIYRGDIKTALSIYKDVKGEIVIVVEKNNDELDYESLLTEVIELISLGLKSNESLKYIAKKYSASKNILYNMLEERKNEIDSWIR